MDSLYNQYPKHALKKMKKTLILLCVIAAALTLSGCRSKKSFTTLPMPAGQRPVVVDTTATVTINKD